MLGEVKSKISSNSTILSLFNSTIKFKIKLTLISKIHSLFSQIISHIYPQLSIILEAFKINRKSSQDPLQLASEVTTRKKANLFDLIFVH